MPNKKVSSDEPLSVAALLLAAGSSHRTGAINKLLNPHKKRPLVEHIANTLSIAAFDEVLAVTGHESERIEHVLAEFDIPCIFNAQYKTGIASSVTMGINNLHQHAAVMVFPADMPDINVSAIETLKNRFKFNLQLAKPPLLLIPSFDRIRGNPVLISAPLFPALGDLKGDSGVRQLFEALADVIQDVETDCAGVLKDVDLLSDFDR